MCVRACVHTCVRYMHKGTDLWLCCLLCRSKLVQSPALGLNDGSLASFPTLGHIRAADICTTSEDAGKGPQGPGPLGFLLSAQQGSAWLPSSFQVHKAFLSRS